MTCSYTVNPLSANPEKWSNTLKQIVGNLPTICLSVFDHFMNLALKGLNTTEKKMTICKNKNWSPHQNSIKIPHFYCKQKSRFIFRHLILKKSLKMFIT